MAILELIDVSKSFGEKKVLNHLSLTVKEKTIFGFIGKNGAGKTTTMKLILGLLKKDAGTIKVNDETVHYGQTKTNRWIGYLPDIPMFYDYLTAEEYLQLCGEITEMPKHKIQQKTQELLALVGLAHEKKRIRTFSRGMKQRLGIAQGLLNEPKLFIVMSRLRRWIHWGVKKFWIYYYVSKSKQRSFFPHIFYQTWNKFVMKWLS